MPKARRTKRPRRRKSPTRPEEQVVVSDLLEPLELAALERLLTPNHGVRQRLLRLLREHDVDVDAIEIEVVGGRVSLRGSVDDPLTSLLVEDLAYLVPQVQQCSNRLHVQSAA